MTTIKNFDQHLFSRVGIRLKTTFRETRQEGNGKMELGGKPVRVTSGTQLKGILKQRDRDIEVGKLRYS